MALIEKAGGKGPFVKTDVSREDEIAALVARTVDRRPPFTRESAAEKVRLTENGWNGRNAEKVALVYTVGSWWRNRSEFIQGRPTT